MERRKLRKKNSETAAKLFHPSMMDLPRSEIRKDSPIIICLKRDLFIAMGAIARAQTIHVFEDALADIYKSLEEIDKAVGKLSVWLR